MEKMLVAIEPQYTNLTAMRFACYLARITRSPLQILFIEKAALTEEVLVARTRVGDAVIETFSLTESVETPVVREPYLQLLQDVAELEGVQVEFQTEPLLQAADLIARTRYADILIIDSRDDFDESNEPPGKFIRNLLQQTECPVILVPENFEEIDSIVFCYNGMKSSVFAIKQFMYLFPQFKNKRAKVIGVNLEEALDEEEMKSLTQWLDSHFEDVEFVSLENEAATAFFRYLLLKQNDFVVMGAYGKGLLASLFDKDGQISNAAGLPAFISHY